MEDVIKIYVELVRRLSTSPNTHASAREFADGTALQVFDAGKRPVVAALLTIATILHTGSGND